MAALGFAVRRSRCETEVFRDEGFVISLIFESEELEEAQGTGLDRDLSQETFLPMVFRQLCATG